MAIKTLVRITSPPSPISQMQPLLPSIVLELVLQRVACASSEPSRQISQTLALPGNASEEPALSEQSVFIMTMIDALPFLPTDTLDEWLPIVANSLRVIEDQTMLHTCKKRFWEVLSSGEMDVVRAAQAVAWWTTRGGREMVLHGNGERDGGPFMSGALGEMSKL